MILGCCECLNVGFVWLSDFSLSRRSLENDGINIRLCVEFADLRIANTGAFSGIVEILMHCF
jgi:hypothetical protein